jgi:acetyltransferase
MLDLRRLLNPASIAVVGASEGRRHGGEIMRSLLKMGYKGSIYPVNPKYHRIYEVPCYSRLSEITDGVDCVVLAINSRQVIPTIEEAAQNGIRAAFVISAGFAETGGEGRALQSRLHDTAQDLGLIVGGPNSLGFINTHGNLAIYSGSLPETLVPGNIGVVAQSGSVCSAIAGAGRGLGFSYVISSGNEAHVSTSDYIKFLVADPNTKVIVAFIEGIKKPEQFLEAAEAALDSRKPLVVLKVGKTEQSRKAAASHTGSLAGSDAVHDALFRQKGIIRVEDIDELLETAELLAGLESPQLGGDGIGMIAISGGEAALIHDLAADFGLCFPSLSPSTVEELAQVLPDFAVIGNPLDVTGAGAVHRPTYKKALQLLSRQQDINLVAVMQDVRQGHWVISEIAATVAQVASESSKPFVFFTNVSRGLSKEVHDALGRGSVPLLQGARESVTAISSLVWYSRFQRERSAVETISSQPRGAVAARRVQELLSGRSGTLEESVSRSLLQEYGIPVCSGILVSTVEEALAGAEEIGFPAVLKVESPDISHKTDVGGVELNIRSRSQLIHAWDRLMKNVRDKAPLAEILGVSVQQMAPSGTEVIVGTARDPQFGPTILLGLGGVFVELLDDVSLRVLPISRSDAQSLISDLRARQVFFGTRGLPRLDVDALIDTLLRVSDLATDCRELINAIDINPLIVYPDGQGCIAVDALVELAPPDGSVIDH